MTGREILIKLAILCKNDRHAMLLKLQNKSFKELESKEFKKEYKKQMADLKSRGVKIVTILDEEYPEALKNMYSPILVFYYTGNLNILTDVVKYDTKAYTYLTGPNKFELDENDLITSKFNIISFGNNELNLWTDMSVDILRIVPLISKNIVCTRTLKRGDPFNIIVECSVAYGDGHNDIFVVPTLEPSMNNRIINSVAYLLDSKDMIL